MGRVLVDIDFSRGLAGKLGRGDLDSVLRLAADEDFVAYSSGRLTPNEFYARVLDKSGLHCDYPEFCHLWCNIFLEMAGMEELVARVAVAYPLGLLSDTDPLHWEFIRENYPWIGRTFTRPALSFQLGVMKPDPKAFREAADLLGVEVEECLFIDDLPQNIEGARECGMEGIVFSGAESLTRQLVSLGILDNSEI